NQEPIPVPCSMNRLNPAEPKRANLPLRFMWIPSAAWRNPSNTPFRIVSESRREGESKMKRQRGALTVITPLIILLVILFSALALDGARLYAMRGQMQSIANAAATAAADAAQACGGGPITLADIQSSADSAARAQGMDD